MPHPLSADTDETSEEVQLGLLRSASIARKTALAFSLTRTVVELSRRSLARLEPNASEAEVGLRFVALHYGEELARGVRQRLSSKPGT
jgi:hypothetical protein